MDKKAELMLNHYKKIIEERLFDEYDILGFLIFIRSKLDKNAYPCIYDLCDFIAHRERNKGIAMKAIESAIDNGYQTENDGKKVKGYSGIKPESWGKEWLSLGKEIQITLSEDSIEEIMLCVFSLLQFSEYNDGKGNCGKIILFENKDNEISLCTTEGKSNSLYVCFSKFGKYKFKKEYSAGEITDAVQTVRIDSKLCLVSDSNDIII